MIANWHPSPSHPEETGPYIVTCSDGRVTTATWRKACRDVFTDEMIYPGMWIWEGCNLYPGLSVTAWTEWPEAYTELIDRRGCMNWTKLDPNNENTWPLCGLPVLAWMTKDEGRHRWAPEWAAGVRTPADQFWDAMNNRYYLLEDVKYWTEIDRPEGLYELEKD